MPVLTPTTWNPAAKGASVTLNGTNLIASGCSLSNAVRSVFGATSGKWYWELTFAATCTAIVGVGDASATLSGNVGSDAHGWGYGEAGFKYHNPGTTSIGTTFTAGNTVGIALDMDAGTMSAYKNGVLVTSGPLWTGITGTIYALASGDTSSATGAITANFGATAFNFSPPAGYQSGFGQSFTISGNVKDTTGANTSRTVRAYRRDTGAQVGSATSDATTGNFSITVPTVDECTVLVLDDAAGTLENDLVARVIPA